MRVLPALPEFRLEAYFSRWEFTARYNLTASDAQTMSLAQLLELDDDDDGRARWQSLHFGYTETWGLPALREEIASTYDHVAPEDVICFAGAEEAIYLAMQVLLEPSDHAEAAASASRATSGRTESRRCAPAWCSPQACCCSRRASTGRT